MEKISEADTVIFDKTGTLTKACPAVVNVVPFNGEDPKEMLRVAACLTELLGDCTYAATAGTKGKNGRDKIYD